MSTDPYIKALCSRLDELEWEYTVVTEQRYSETHHGQLGYRAAPRRPKVFIKLEIPTLTLSVREGGEGVFVKVPDDQSFSYSFISARRDSDGSLMKPLEFAYYLLQKYLPY